MKEKIINPLLPRPAIIKDKTIESFDTFSLTLSPVDGKTFKCKPGQFNMVGLPGFGEAPFSFSRIDASGKEFVHTIRNAGNVVAAISSLKKGQQVSFRGPYGNCWPVEEAKHKNVIVVCGGIGMAPLRPVMHHLVKNRNKFGECYLLYGTKEVAEILYKDELKQWSKSINVLLSSDKVTEKGPLPVAEGLVTTLFNQMNVSLDNTITFTCGPQIMMKFVAAELILKGQNPDDIYISLERRMKCGLGHCGHCQIGAKFVCRDGAVFRLTEIRGLQDTYM